MLRSILRLSKKNSYYEQSRFLLRDTTQSRYSGINEIRNAEKDTDDCPYPTFRKFGVETQDRCHRFSIHCDKVLQFINFGAINKQIAAQYCHYIAHLSRTSETIEDRSYYGSKSVELLNFLLSHGNDLPASVISRLISDVSDTTKDNSIMIAKIALPKLSNLPSTPAWTAQLLGAFYKFGLWHEAKQALALTSDKIDFRVAEQFVGGVIETAKEYKLSDPDSLRSKEMKAELISNLKAICDIFRSKRVQFLTRRKDEFVRALKDLGFNVTINPTIKQTGRCTNCETRLPLFDAKSVSKINEAIKKQLLKGSDKGLYINTSPNDAFRFENFLKEIYAKNKKPIDCVIDGLNIAYLSSQGYDYVRRRFANDVSSTHRIPKPENQAHVLINAMIRGDMLTSFKKIVVVGRHHMTRWPGLMNFFQEHKIHFYSSHNNTKDDLFQLFASTISPNTVLVTNDFLRDHLSQLDPLDRINLARWIDTHQVWIEQKTLRPIWPTPYEKLVHYDKERKRFHLAVIDLNLLDQVGVYQPPPHLNCKMTTWLCFEDDAQIKEQP